MILTLEKVLQFLTRPLTLVEKSDHTIHQNSALLGV